MLRRMFARKVVIIGRAIPLTAIMLGLVTVAALAWALFYLALAHVSGTTAPGAPTYTWSANVCAIDGGPGTVTSCNLNAANGIQAVVAGVDDTSVLYETVKITNTSANPLYVCYTAQTLPDYMQIVPLNGGGKIGPIAPGATSGEIDVKVYFVGLTPGVAISGDIGWKVQATACP